MKKMFLILMAVVLFSCKKDIPDWYLGYWYIKESTSTDYNWDRYDTSILQRSQTSNWVYLKQFGPCGPDEMVKAKIKGNQIIIPKQKYKGDEGVVTIEGSGYFDTGGTEKRLILNYYEQGPKGKPMKISVLGKKNFF
jgi:hypothetical protein